MTIQKSKIKNQKHNSKVKSILLSIVTLILPLVTLLLLDYYSPLANAQTPTRQSGKNAAPTPLIPPEAPTTGINLRVSPVFLSLVTEPGQPTSATVKVTNNNNITEYLRIELSRFVPVAEGNPTIADVDPSDPFPGWVNFSDPEFTLAPNETKSIRVTVSPSSDAALGYYYAMVINRIREQEATEQSVVSGAPAVPLILEVKSPNAKREVQLSDFKTDKVFYEYLPTSFQVTVNNTGNIHSSPIGSIFIDWGGRKNIANVIVNEGKGNVLPNSKRTFTAVWDDSMILSVPKVENGKEVMQNGKQVNETKFDFDKPLSKFRIGKYTANLLLVYDNGERDVPLEAQISFWVIPWRILLGVLALILGPVLIFYFISKMRRRRK